MSFLSNGFGWLLGNNESSATGTVTSISTAGLISGGIITVSGTITTSVSTNKLVGRGTSGTGVMEEITLGTNLSLTGTTLNASGGGGGVTSVTGTTPIASSGGATPTISISQATTSTNGYLSSVDWNTFNNKGSGTVTSVGGTLPISSSGGITPNISISQATTSTNGYLSSVDWNTFNNKGSGTVTSVSALTLGTTGTDLSSTIATGTTTPVITLNVPTASASNRGALSSTDWTTFNNKGNGTVTSVGGTLPISSSGGITPNISISQATTSTNGYLSSTDWNTFNNKGSGTVTSVGGTLPISSSGGITPNISISQATTSTNGYLSSTDWNTFNNKGSGTVTSVSALTLGTTGTDLSSTIATGTTTPVITLNVPTASASNRGALSSADWTTFNNKGSGTITSVTGTLPIASSGGTTPTISITQSSGATNGYLSSTDWTTFNNKGSGTVLSVTSAIGDPIIVDNIDPSNPIISSGILVQGVTATSLITSSGGVTPNISTSIQTNKLVGRGTALTGVFEEITLGTNLSLTGTTLNASGGGGTVTSVSALTLGTTGTDLSSTIATGTTTPVITLNVPTASASNRGALSSANWTTFNSKESALTFTSPLARATNTISMPVATTSVNGYLSSTDWTTFNNKGSGTVTSVSASVPTFLSIAGSPITTSGTLAISLSGTALPVLNGGTGVTTSTGSGNTVLSTSPTLVTPILGSASATALTFSSTAVSGLTINRLTTAQRQALTPTSGDVVYDTTIGTTCTYNGTFWDYTIFKKLTSDFSTTSVTNVSITGFTFSVEANSTYLVEGVWMIGTSNTTGYTIGNNLVAGASSYSFYFSPTTSGFLFQNSSNINGAGSSNYAQRFISTASNIKFNGFLVTVATAGNVDLQIRSATVTNTITVLGGTTISGTNSYATFKKIA